MKTGIKLLVIFDKKIRRLDLFFFQSAGSKTCNGKIFRNNKTFGNRFTCSSRTTMCCQLDGFNIDSTATIWPCTARQNSTIRLQKLTQRIETCSDLIDGRHKKKKTGALQQTKFTCKFIRIHSEYFKWLKIKNPPIFEGIKVISSLHFKLTKLGGGKKTAWKQKLSCFKMRVILQENKGANNRNYYWEYWFHSTNFFVDRFL